MDSCGKGPQSLLRCSLDYGLIGPKCAFKSGSCKLPQVSGGRLERRPTAVVCCCSALWHSDARAVSLSDVFVRVTVLIAVFVGLYLLAIFLVLCIISQVSVSLYVSLFVAAFVVVCLSVTRSSRSYGTVRRSVPLVLAVSTSPLHSSSALLKSAFHH